MNEYIKCEIPRTIFQRLSSRYLWTDRQTWLIGILFFFVTLRSERRISFSLPTFKVSYCCSVLKSSVAPNDLPVYSGVSYPWQLLDPPEAEKNEFSRADCYVSTNWPCGVSNHVTDELSSCTGIFRCKETKASWVCLSSDILIT